MVWGCTRCQPPAHPLTLPRLAATPFAATPSGQALASGSGVSRPRPEVERLLRAADLDLDGRVGPGEFLTVMKAAEMKARDNAAAAAAGGSPFEAHRTV